MEYAKDFDEKKYPAVVFAYDIALKSYDWSISRVDAVDGFIDRLLVWISSINIGTLAISAPRLGFVSFNSVWFFLSMGLFLMCIALGIFTKTRGYLRLPTPRHIYNEWLHFSECQFKKNAIFESAKDFEKNCALANEKGRYGRVIMWIFLGNLITLIIWIISHLWT